MKIIFDAKELPEIPSWLVISIMAMIYIGLAWCGYWAYIH